MKLNLNFRKTIDLSTVGYGDVVITEEGNPYLIVRDTDGADYVAVNLETNTRSNFETTVYSLFEDELCEEAVHVIKAENLKLEVC